ncbi:MAG: 50S ribosomal protein L1 [Saprospiraceae bacterium]|nr:50S ribosomal protein L1 [Saprospiraceae bacterium]
MAKVAKRRAEMDKKLDRNKLHTLSEAMNLVKDVNTAKFDASVDVHVRLGIDPRKADQALRGTVSLPHGTGKTKRVLVMSTPDRETDAKTAGADYFGLEEYIQKFQEGWLDVDVIIATPNVMAQLGKVARILGPRGLMPNPKTGTVTANIADAVSEVKKGKIAFRVDKTGIVHAGVGRVSFTPDQLSENANELLQMLLKMKPSSSKGTYMKSLTIASTMSPGIKVDPKTIK